jgi:hypothetical protein
MGLRQFLILAVLAIVVGVGVSAAYQDILTDILTVPADKSCIGCG